MIERLERLAPVGRPRRVALAPGLWAAWYAAYRFYYAFGGTIGMVGRPAAEAHFRRAVTLVILRMLSLTGVHPIHYPPGVWLSIDRRDADLQDALFNEPWFFIESCRSEPGSFSGGGAIRGVGWPGLTRVAPVGLGRRAGFRAG